MSLINDALRKARQEAAEREAEERGSTYRPPRAHLPQQSKLGLGLVLGLVFGFLGAFAGAYLLLRPAAPVERDASSSAAPAAPARSSAEARAPDPNPASEDGGASVGGESASPGRSPFATEAPAIAASNPVESVSTAPPSPEPAAARPASAESAPVAPTPAAPVPVDPAPVAPTPPPERSDVAPSSRAGDLAPAADPAVDPVGGAGTAPARIQPPERVGQVEDSNEFVLEADLGDVQLTLDFIVWIPGRPFAQINGSQVEEGQVVEELLVERIERERVTLRGANGTLVLRVR